MAINTSDIVYLSGSHDSAYQSEVQNIAQQVIYFIDNIVPMFDNESLSNDSYDSESVDSANTNFKLWIRYRTWKRFWNGMGIIDSDPWANVWPFLGEEMPLMDPDNNEPHLFFEALFESQNWNHISHKTNRYAETRIRKW